ncbi:MAG TPA: dienelactone hydrolase family protein [Gemmatimonadaceae bacterium]|nr:dienelactone hydrolase family protein [Gemmatimonadaceae bacterium]
MTTATHPEQRTRTVMIPTLAMLPGDLTVPAGATGLVIFAHGSGSSRLSERNQRVAARLQAGGLATLLFDLLTMQEEKFDTQTAQLRFDISLLAERLVSVTEWTRGQPSTSGLRVGYFGASTGAAAALVAAAARPELVHAVVSRGGRPDLAGPYLGRVHAPTLLIVGGEDLPVMAMNRAAMRQLGRACNELALVSGASHLFEEPGAMDHVADLALDWFQRHLGAAPEPVAADEIEIC